MKELHDVNRWDMQDIEHNVAFKYVCSTCYKILTFTGTAESLRLPREASKAIATHASDEPVIALKSKLFGARVMLREYMGTDVGNTSMVRTSATDIYFCSRLCRSIYKARLEVMLYPKYYPDVKDRVASWHGSLLDKVPFDNES